VTSVLPPLVSGLDCGDRPRLSALPSTTTTPLGHSVFADRIGPPLQWKTWGWSHQSVPFKSHWVSEPILSDRTKHQPVNTNRKRELDTINSFLSLLFGSFRERWVIRSRQDLSWSPTASRCQGSMMMRAPSRQTVSSSWCTGHVHQQRRKVIYRDHHRWRVLRLQTSSWYPIKTWKAYYARTMVIYSLSRRQ